MATRSSSPGRADLFWLDPANIRFKLSPISDLHGVQPGDWDIARRFALTDAVKHRSIAQRYRDGIAWEDTELFRETYPRRLGKGRSVRGETTLQGLLAQYYDRVDGLFRSLERDGFLERSQRGRAWPLPGLYLGRDGDVFIGNQGNHRLAMAQIIGLKEFAGRVVCRWGSRAVD